MITSKIALISKELDSVPKYHIRLVSTEVISSNPQLTRQRKIFLSVPIHGLFSWVETSLYSNRPDRVAEFAEHWASIPKIVGSIPTVARHIFQACPVWIYTQRNTTSIIFTLQQHRKIVFGDVNLVPRASVWGLGERRGSPGPGRSRVYPKNGSIWQLLVKEWRDIL